MKKAIVITTINPPSEALIKFSKMKEFRLYVAGDNKSPTEWELENTTYLSMATQSEKYGKLSSLITQNHYTRKNLAYLEAINSGNDYIYETDDDNIPYDFFPRFSHKKMNLLSIASEPAFNIYSLFTKEPIWPRGLPLKMIKNPKIGESKKEITPLIQQSLADLDPDVDAIYRLTNGKLVTFKKNIRVSLAKGTYCPFNSQNTYWHKSVFPLLYLPSTVESRVTDIWRGYIAQRILWELGSEVIFSSASVYQKRNEHDYLKDFVQEIELYTRVDSLLETLSSLQLTGSVPEMLIQVYKALISKSYFKQQELDTVQEWLGSIK